MLMNFCNDVLCCVCVCVCVCVCLYRSFYFAFFSPFFFGVQEFKKRFIPFYPLLFLFPFFSFFSSHQQIKINNNEFVKIVSSNHAFIISFRAANHSFFFSFFFFSRVFFSSNCE